MGETGEDINYIWTKKMLSIDWKSHDFLFKAMQKKWSAAQAAGTDKNIIMYLCYQLSPSMVPLLPFPPPGIMFWKIFAY